MSLSALLARFAVPSMSPSLPSRTPLRLLAVLAVRDEMRYLPDFLVNVGPHVEGIIALDDGSVDGSAEFLESSPLVLQTIRVSPHRAAWDEVGNFRRLVVAALAYDPDWFVSLDADERVESEFRTRAERVIRRGALFGLTAYSVRLRELWDSQYHYRVDGLWGRKAPARLFQARRDHQFDPQPMHAVKAPLQGRRGGVFPLADLELYHLRMIRHEDRLLRRVRYEQADPTARWQPGTGYEYLTDERGIRLRSIERGRGFVPATAY